MTKDIQIGKVYKITESSTQIGKYYNPREAETKHITYLVPISKVVRHPSIPGYDSVHAVTLDFPDLHRNFSLEWLIRNNIELVEGYEE